VPHNRHGPRQFRHTFRRSVRRVLSLPDTLQVSMGTGSLIGGFVGTMWEANTGRAIVDNVVVGSTLGGLIGGMFGVAVWGAMYLDHGY